MMKLKVRDLIWDRQTYGRQQTSDNTISQYAAALEIGARFPSIKVEYLINYPGSENGSVVVSIRDGYHRWRAHQKQGLDTIEAEFWTDEILDYADRVTRSLLMAKSAFYNKLHGDRTSEKDKKMVARYIAENDPEKEWTEQAIADEIGASQQSVSEWIGDIRAKQGADRNAVIYRLSRLGWTQQRIADAVGHTRQRVQQIANSTDLGKICNFLKQRIDEDKVNTLIQEALKTYRLDMPLAWSIRLDGQSDLDRFGMAASNKENAKNLKWGPYPYDFWNFHQCDQRFGDDWPGRIPAQIVGHVLYFFSEQGDLVMDPMAGGGVVPDVCLVLNRKCQAFDIVPGTSEKRAHQRPEIEFWNWNLDDMEWPNVRPNLIFWDPPYFDKKDKDYKEVAGDLSSISSLSKKEYLAFFRQWFALAKQNIRPNGTLAFLMSDWNDNETSEGIFIWDYAKLLQDTGWTLTRHIQVPLSTQSFHGDFVTKFRKAKKLGRLERYLLIAHP